jgi:hypothetical protein
VSGFFGAFDEALTVLMAGVTVAVAGSLSMAASAYVASSSEHEVRQREREKRAFLGEDAAVGETVNWPVSAALLVGSSYFTGATVPVLPVLFGAKHVLWSLLVSGSMIILMDGTHIRQTGCGGGPPVGAQRECRRDWGSSQGWHRHPGRPDSQLNIEICGGARRALPAGRQAAKRR